MRRLVLSVVLALAAPFAFAAQPPSDAQLDRLLELVRARALLETTLTQVSQIQHASIEQAMQGHAVAPEQKARLERLTELMDKRMREALAWEKMGPMYKRLYTSTFEAEDIDAMIKFYETPSGQRVIDRMPTLMQNTMQEVQTIVVPMMEQFEQDVQKEFGEG